MLSGVISMGKFSGYLFHDAFTIGVMFLLIDNQLFQILIDDKLNDSVVLLSSFAPFVALLILIGGSILLTLTYVSWRKYRGIKKLQKHRKEKSNR